MKLSFGYLYGYKNRRRPIMGTGIIKNGTLQENITYFTIGCELSA